MSIKLSAAYSMGKEKRGTQLYNGCQIIKIDFLIYRGSDHNV